MLAGIGSQRIAAGSYMSTACSTATKSFQGTIAVASAWARGHARAGRDRLRREARAGLGEQAVDVAVVGAGELDQPLAAGRRAGEADRAHRRLGPGVDHPDHLDRGEAVGDLGGELDLALGGGAVGGAARGGGGDRLDDARVGVAEDQRAPGADPVDVGVAVGVEDAVALGAVDEDRVAADRAHRPDRRVDAARHQPERARVELSRPLRVQLPQPRWPWRPRRTPRARARAPRPRSPA